ncbi:hypothetical protein AVEN_231261-1 [Araneus ventricosus]|uniref:Major facilitator superfamily associated domain-containing protein n=1 Tax=Araneus ventricosus TaxID=182803 RepID=A0A4Y2CKF8_ARAVE|nr:hypothetical protein AVEN_231261-1 [Araneus ventricosus]
MLGNMEAGSQLRRRPRHLTTDQNLEILCPTFSKLVATFFLPGSSAIYPCIYIYAKQLGMTANVVGYITSAMWCITVLSRPPLGGLADHFQKFKLVLICILVTSITTDLGLSYIPMPKQETNSSSTINSSIICHQNKSYYVQFRTDSCQTGFPN